MQERLSLFGRQPGEGEWDHTLVKATWTLSCHKGLEVY